MQWEDGIAYNIRIVIRKGGTRIVKKDYSAGVVKHAEGITGGGDDRSERMIWRGQTYRVQIGDSEEA